MTTSPTTPSIEKGEFYDTEPRNEEVEDDVYQEREADPNRMDGGNSLRPPLSKTRSKSSSRSHQSHTDGYSHFYDGDNHDEEHGRHSQLDAGESPEKAFEVQWDGPDDPHNPKTNAWGSIARKWSIILLLASASACVTCASAIYTSTYDQLEQEFQIGREVATLGLSIFVVGLMLGPMFLSPLSEFYGRRPIYLVAFGMYLIWLVPCAVAQNTATMMISRFFNGLAGSAFLSVAGGTVGDTFPRDKLSAPMMIFTASPFVGPELGPIIGGFVNYYADWRWSFYLLIIWAAVQWVLIFIFVPETYSPVLLRKKAIKLRKESGDDRWKAPIEVMQRSVTKTVLWSCIRPLQLLWFEPMCLNLCLLSAILLGILYLFFGAFAVVFTNNHGFNLWQTGLTFIGILLGMIAAVCCDVFTRKNYRRLVRNNKGVSEPEFRLPPTIIGAMIVPISLFGFGWTTFPWVHWIVPIIFSFFFGLGNILCFGGVFTFLVDCYPLYAASALAANAFARSAFAAAFPLFGVQMYDGLGYQWASSLLGFIALAMAPFPILFYKFGKKLRGKSRFAQA